jgi:general secretion pathway protein D
LLAEADGARAKGDGARATALYRRVQRLQPGNDRALRGLEGVQADRRHAERIARATQLAAAKDLDAAQLEVRAVLAEDPSFAPARALQSTLDLAHGPTATVPRLKTHDSRSVTLQFRDAPTKMVFEVLARQTGLNFVFDKDVKSEGKTTIFVNQVPVEQAIDLILAQNQLGSQVLSENLVLIYPNTAAKQKDYQDEIVHTFYLTNAAPKDAEAMLKTVLGTKTLFVDEHSSTLVMRDTPEHVRMAEKLVATLDLPEPEVIMEVEVLEIAHSLAEQLGINYPTSVSFSPTSILGGGAGALVLSDLPKQSANTITVSPLTVSIDLMKAVGASNVLSSPRIRARNKEKAKILVGNRLPVVTSGTSATVGGAFSTSNVQYIDVGLTLEVQPTIHNDGDVAIKVALEVSSILKQINVPIGNGGSTLAYEIGTRNASTLLELKDGETQVLAGLIQDTEQRNSSHIPGLGDLPILGRLFGSNGKTHDKTEIVLSITPRIIRAQPRPASEATEFWYGSESQMRTAPIGSGSSAGPASAPAAPGGGSPGTGPAAPGGGLPSTGPAAPGGGLPSTGPAASGGGSFGAGSAVESPSSPPMSSGPRAIPTRIPAAAGPPPAPPPPVGDGAAAAPGSKAATPQKPADAAPPDATGAGEGASADNRPKVSIEGPDTAKVGDEVSVSVRLASTSPLGRIRTQVGFDAAALQLVSAEPGDLAPSGESPKVDLKPGGVQLELAGSDGAPVSGGGSLINLRFRVVAARPAITIATQVVLVGEDGVAVAATQATPLKIAVTE